MSTELDIITSSTSCDSNCADMASRDLSHLEKNKKNIKHSMNFTTVTTARTRPIEGCNGVHMVSKL